MAEKRLEIRRTLQRRRTSDHRAIETVEEREERLSRHRGVQQQRDRTGTETEAWKTVASLTITSGIAPTRPKCLAFV